MIWFAFEQSGEVTGVDGLEILKVSAQTKESIAYQASSFTDQNSVKLHVNSRLFRPPGLVNIHHTMSHVYSSLPKSARYGAQPSQPFPLGHVRL